MNIGRPIEFDRAVALDQAKQLFWRKGYRDTSLADLLAATGLSKSSFYQSFKSKHQLFQSTIEIYVSERTAMMRDKLRQSRSAYDFIKAMLYGVAGGVALPEYRVGCLVMNTACEFAQSDQVIAAAVSHSMAEFTKVFKEAVLLAQQQGDIPANRDADALAAFLVTNMGGLNVAYKAGAEPNHIKKTADVTLAALK